MSRCMLQRPAAASRDVELDPKVQCHDGAENFLIRVDLPGFKTEDFRVVVDGAGRVTVRGQRPAGGQVRVHRVIQLPPTADLDRIAARFDGAALHLTVPKLSACAARIATAKAVPEWAAEKEEERGRWDNGQVLAAAVAAFALGAILTHRLFSATNA